MSKGVQLKDKSGEKVYPRPYYAVGDLYLTTNTTNPNLLFGGVWQLFGPGRCLVCVDTSQTEFNTVKKTGGTKTENITTNQITKANSQMFIPTDVGSTAEGWWRGEIKSYGSGSYKIGEAGFGGQSHNNLQPFITCYVWLRTA